MKLIDFLFALKPVFATVGVISVAVITKILSIRFFDKKRKYHPDDTWPDGFSVRKGDLVSFQPSCGGEDADKFRPERLLDENGILKKESPFKFTAFHNSTELETYCDAVTQAGPRICLGKEFAYRQMKIYSTLLLGSHSFKLADQNKPVKYRTMLTLQIEGGLHVYASLKK
ncbi:hypothetical protein V8G54_029300 [Vigna mungo]|uniref:Cytochrome P450 n=1 Tax=Vigna mungo TaxID=3915 RepID=A0AAQ3MT50_VIGMU